MIRRLKAVTFNRAVTSGRTNPLLITCLDDAGVDVDVVAKISAGCDRQETALAMELIASCLAGDLQLPVPEPFVVELDDRWIELIPELVVKARVETSCRLAFGSRFITPQYSPWHEGISLPNTQVQTAAAILVFDAITQNSDRRVGNPNCLVKGEELRIIDHELTFCHRMLLNWRPPWEPGGLRAFETPGNHIFVERLKHRQIDFDVIRAAWVALSDAAIADYEAAIPADWRRSPADIASAINLIRNARDNIDGCIREVQRVLT